MSDRTSVLNRLLSRLKAAGRLTDGKAFTGVGFELDGCFVAADEASARLAREFSTETGTPISEAQRIVDAAIAGKTKSETGFVPFAAPGCDEAPGDRKPFTMVDLVGVVNDRAVPPVG